jgi:subtilisin family serine protease
MQAIEIWKKGFTGNDILVAHLDTGVDSEHPALKDAISDHLVVDREGDETAPQNPYKDSGVHGTLTAGVIAGRNKANEPVIGMAPDAKLACATVITGGETVLRVLTGMNWAVGIGARILHMSLSFRGCNDSFEDTMEILRANHVLPVIAIGNSGPNSSRSPGNYKTALSVGAIDQSNEVVFDSSSPKPGGNAVGPSLCAPGWLISSSHAGGGYQAKSGTSMATPHITGLAALLFDAQPNATIDQIQEAIIASCENPTGVEKLRIGAGIPNSLKALNILTELI